PRVPRLLRARAALGQRRALRILRRGVDALVAAALAPSCAACGHPLDAPSRGCVCPLCWGAVSRLPPPPWTDADITIGAAGGHYEGALRDIIHAYKYEGRRSLARPLGRLMREAGAALLDGAD